MKSCYWWSFTSKKELFSGIGLGGLIFLSGQVTETTVVTFCCRWGAHRLWLSTRQPQNVLEYRESSWAGKPEVQPPAATRFKALCRRAKAGKEARREDGRPWGRNQNRNKKSSGTLGLAENYLLDKSKKAQKTSLRTCRPITSLWISVCVWWAVFAFLSFNWIQNKPKSLEKNKGL